MSPIKDKSIGVILYHEFPRSIKFLILKHKKGHWSFAKGHRNNGETEIETARRELHEETGIDEIEFFSKKILLRENYIFLKKNNVEVEKTVEYFIARSKTKTVKIDRNEITNFRWCTPSAGEKLITFRESRNSLIKANKIILNKTKV